jgi:RHS repeat-associated protein
MEVKSNIASGMPVCLWREGTGSRSSSKERDQETGLDYFGARYMSAAEGRFTSPDPGAYKIEDHQTFNRHAYVNNNPLKYIDPSGREARYVIDWNKKTITFYITITLWGPDTDYDYVKKLKQAAENTWKVQYIVPFPAFLATRTMSKILQ